MAGAASHVAPHAERLGGPRDFLSTFPLLTPEGLRPRGRPAARCGGEVGVGRLHLPRSARYADGASGRRVGWDRSGHGVEAAGRAGAPACDLWTPSAGGRTESRREARPGPLNQGGLATAWSRSEGRSGRLNREGAPFLVLLVKKKEALRGERGGGEGGLREGQLVWYKFLQECQWFEQGVVFGCGRLRFP